MRRLLLCLPLVCVLIAADSSTTVVRRSSDLPDVSGGGKLPTNEEMERLAQTDPVAFLENTIRRYNRDVKGYHCVLKKQERIGGELGRSSLMDVDFREEPFSVRLKWLQGAGAAQAILYVKGQNHDKLLALPTGLLARIGPVERDVDGPEARKTSRVPVSEFGIKIGTQRALAAWKKAQAQDALHVQYLGQKRVKELNNRLCFVLRRDRYAQPEEDGILAATFYFDTETWLQLGSVLKGEENKLIGEYLFRDVQLNPDFSPDTFSRAGLAAGR